MRLSKLFAYDNFLDIALSRANSDHLIAGAGVAIAETRCASVHGVSPGLLCANASAEQDNILFIINQLEKIFEL